MTERRPDGSPPVGSIPIAWEHLLGLSAKELSEEIDALQIDAIIYDDDPVLMAEEAARRARRRARRAAWRLFWFRLWPSWAAQWDTHRMAETGTGSVEDESAVAESDAPKSPPGSHP